MNLKTHQECVIDCILSLQNSLQNAGGCVNRDVEQLQKMTVYDLIDLIAPNGIRFVWTPNKVINK